MNTKNVFRKILIVAAMGATCGITFAAVTGTKTTAIAVSASVASNCLISATPLLFNVYDPLATTNKTATSTISVKCNKNAMVSIALDKGMGASASETARSMSLATTEGMPAQDPLNYALYADAGYATNWGTAAGAQPATGTGLDTAVILNVYGKIPMNQYTAGVGTYNDTVTATVTY